ncbi:hypothetical protein M5D96_013419 [Drosophila gunungcola]|uniref:Uncharacterized protein n=1 Tax=Drosophila gunungcola TaxID=103775 RepID=A0A9P9YBG2_9MUSC|nr:hypothetical protein M5D96_013419 [Drosophila gunungcola]
MQIQILVDGRLHRYRCAVAEQNFRLEICQPLMALFDAISSTPIDGGRKAADRDGGGACTFGDAANRLRRLLGPLESRYSAAEFRIRFQYSIRLRRLLFECGQGTEQHQNLSIRIPNRASSER